MVAVSTVAPYLLYTTGLSRVESGKASIMASLEPVVASVIGVLVFQEPMVTDEPSIRDEMYADASLHQENGAWQAIFGVNTLPEYRRRGLAAKLLTAAADDARAAGRRGCILTCKNQLISWYEKLGYRNQGVSQSIHACIDAGANVLVAGSAVYKAPDIPARIRLLRG